MCEDAEETGAHYGLRRNVNNIHANLYSMHTNLPIAFHLNNLSGSPLENTGDNPRFSFINWEKKCQLDAFKVIGRQKEIKKRGD